MNEIETMIVYTPNTLDDRFLPEGPYAIDGQRFSWVAIQNGPSAKVGSLNIFNLEKYTNQVFPLPGRPGFAFATTKENVFVIGCERELGLFDITDQSWTVICTGIDSDCENTIINDGVVYKDKLIFGTKDLEFQNTKANLYLFDMSTRKLTRLADKQICSNGKAIFHDESGKLQLLDIDTPTQEVAIYDLDLEAAKISNRRVALDCHDQPGYPDGMILAPDQKSIFISFYNPDHAPKGQTRQFSLADGKVITAYLTDQAPQNTCPQLCKLGDKVYLIITTAVEHMPHERHHQSPNSGSIFIAQTNYTSGSDCPKFELTS